MVQKPAQEFVPIKEIRNGVVILNDGSLRMVLMTSSHNLALKSADEQQAILVQFQNFLNSLDFSVQIFVQSRRLDIRPYVALLEERERLQKSDLMKIQVTEYINFIKKFTESVSIVTKSFFIVVPYTPSVISSSKENPLSKIFGKKRDKAQRADLALELFEEQKSQLEQRSSVVEQGLARTGLRAVPLGTEELVELYYRILNPGELEKPIPVKQD